MRAFTEFAFSKLTKGNITFYKAVSKTRLTNTTIPETLLSLRRVQGTYVSGGTHHNHLT